MVDINTTPLIDVMLVLLIMFIITIPIQTHAVKMNMPVPSNAPPPPKPPEIIRIDVDFDGTIGWNGEIIADRATLESRLQPGGRRARPARGAPAPQQARHLQGVAMIMASAQRLGVTKIGIVGNEQFLNCTSTLVAAARLKPLRALGLSLVAAGLVAWLTAHRPRACAPRSASRCSRPVNC
jgi:biopolymer transport protein ExbD